MLTNKGYATGKGRHASSPTNQPPDVKATMPTKMTKSVKAGNSKPSSAPCLDGCGPSGSGMMGGY